MKKNVQKVLKVKKCDCSVLDYIFTACLNYLGMIDSSIKN